MLRTSETAWLSEGAAQELRLLREAYEGLLETGSAPLEDTPDGVQWHTFAGGAVNRLLAAGLQHVTGKKWTSGNLSVQAKDVGMAAAGEGVRELPGQDWESIASVAAHNMVRGMLSKFQPCLPEEAEDRLLAERLLDLPETLRFLGSVKVNGRRAVTRPAGLRLVDANTDVPATVDIPKQEGTEVLTPKNEVQWVDTQAALRSVCQALKRESVIGLDVETTLDFGTLCLVQVAVPERTYLIDPLAVVDLAPLREVFGVPEPVKVIHNAKFERRVLAAVGIELDGVFDTLEASKKLRGEDVLGGHSLAAVCERELGVSIDKGEQTSNWGRRPLDAEQLRYAALDAEVLLRLLEALGQERARDE